MVPRQYAKFSRDLVFVFNATEMACNINHYQGIADKANCAFEIGGTEFKHAPHLAFSVRRYQQTTDADFPFGQLLADYGSTFVEKRGAPWATSYDEETGPFPEDSTGSQLLERLASSSPSDSMGGGGGSSSSSSSSTVASSSSSSSSSSEVASSSSGVGTTINVGFWDAIALQELGSLAGEEEEAAESDDEEEAAESDDEDEAEEECPGCEDELGPFLEQHLKSLDDADALHGVTKREMYAKCKEEFPGHCTGKKHRKFIKDKMKAILNPPDKSKKKKSSTPARKSIGMKAPRSAVSSPEENKKDKKRFGIRPCCLY